jgi:hypothetical protein
MLSTLIMGSSRELEDVAKWRSAYLRKSRHVLQRLGFTYAAGRAEPHVRVGITLAISSGETIRPST